MVRIMLLALQMVMLCTVEHVECLELCIVAVVQDVQGA